MDNYRIRIRDWDIHFEQDRSRRYKNILWVPIPNKQGFGYKSIIRHKRGFEIFTSWISLLQCASKCDPRGDLSKYDLEGLSVLTLISPEVLSMSIKYLSQDLDWIEVISNLDTPCPSLDHNNPVGSSVLFNSVLFNSILSHLIIKEHMPTSDCLDTKEESPLNSALEDFREYRKKIKKPMTEKAEDLLLKKLERLAPNNQDLQIKIIEQSIVNGWTGVFPYNDGEQSKPNRNQYGPQPVSKEFLDNLNKMEFEE